nr:methyltransferase domain-containing protein [Lutispora thermophila]
MQLIGQYPQIGIIDLAKLQGVTKGATSQMIKKLVEKGLVVKKQSTTSEAEICLELTELGQRAFRGHADYYNNVGKQWKEILDQMSEDDIQVLMRFISLVEKMLDAEKLPYQDGMFDIIICNASFHHYTNPKAVLTQMRRVLKDRGMLLIDDPWMPQPLRSVMNFFTRYSNHGDYHYYGERKMGKHTIMLKVIPIPIK